MDRTILITGATDGLGRETAHELAARGATVLLHGRDAAKLEAVLAHFLLTTRLLDLLRASASARIVNVSSAGQSAIDFDDLAFTRGYEPFEAYARSKLAQIMFTFALAERLRAEGEHGVTVTALHPATLMDTKMVRSSFGTPLTSVRDGAEPTVRLVLSPDVEDVSGEYFDGLRRARPHRQALDGAARERLWQLSEQLVEAALERAGAV